MPPLSPILIIGGGLVGGVCALHLAQAGLPVLLLDREDFKKPPAMDGRTTAISFGSRKILAAIGVWEKLAEHANPIQHIAIHDGKARLHFHHPAQAMGHIVENWRLRQTIRRALQQAKNITIADKAVITALDASATGITLCYRSAGAEKNRILPGSLLIIADGRNSEWRKILNLHLRTHDYGQTAVIANVYHQIPHRDWAYECFLPSGPLALLPMADGENGRPQSSLIWTEHTARARALADLSADDFCALLQEKFGPDLGGFTLVTPRQSYPLQLLYTEGLAAPRMALIGDAAHALHPIAGQGLNLGLRDVENLTKTIATAAARGLDIGSGDVLKNYARTRQADIQSLIMATHGLNAVFGWQHPGLRLLRGLGLRAVDAVPGLKPFFIRRAMGDFAA